MLTRNPNEKNGWPFKRNPDPIDLDQIMKDFGFVRDEQFPGYWIEHYSGLRIRHRNLKRWAKESPDLNKRIFDEVGKILGMKQKKKEKPRRNPDEDLRKEEKHVDREDPVAVERLFNRAIRAGHASLAKKILRYALERAWSLPIEGERNRPEIWNKTSSRMSDALIRKPRSLKRSSRQTLEDFLQKELILNREDPFAVEELFNIALGAKNIDLAKKLQLHAFKKWAESDTEFFGMIRPRGPWIYWDEIWHRMDLRLSSLKRNPDEDLRQEERDLDKEDPIAVEKLFNKALRYGDTFLAKKLQRIAHHIYDGSYDKGPPHKETPFIVWDKLWLRMSERLPALEERSRLTSIQRDPLWLRRYRKRY